MSAAHPLQPLGGRDRGVGGIRWSGRPGLHPAWLCVPFLARVSWNLLLWRRVLSTNTPGSSGSGKRLIPYAPLTPPGQVGGQCVRPGSGIPLSRGQPREVKASGETKAAGTRASAAAAELRGPWALRGTCAGACGVPAALQGACLPGRRVAALGLEHLLRRHPRRASAGFALPTFQWGRVVGESLGRPWGPAAGRMQPGQTRTRRGEEPGVGPRGGSGAGQPFRRREERGAWGGRCRVWRAKACVENSRCVC